MSKIFIFGEKNLKCVQNYLITGVEIENGEELGIYLIFTYNFVQKNKSFSKENSMLQP